MSTLKVINAIHPSGSTNNLVLDSSGNVTAGNNLTVTGNLSFNSGYGSVATAYGCRAWVNFNGTGTVAIRGSGNVTSITDNGTGDYTINFTSSMSDVNYCYNIGYDISLSTTNNGMALANEVSRLTSSLQFNCRNTGGTATDMEVVCASVFR